MKHKIDPKVDCVFKALLGSTENSNLCVHFLNALLGNELAAPITEVSLLNPYSEKETLDDKINIVDVKAHDQNGNWYQIEIQVVNHAHLISRMVYTWADLYSQQLKEGQKYHLLKPTYSIWILNQNFLKHDNHYLHDVQWRDNTGQRFAELGGIWLVELNKFKLQAVDNEQARWLSFFQKGEQFDETNLPDWMITPEMEQAMTILKRFSDKDANYHAYQARQNALRVQWDFEYEKERLQREALESKEKAEIAKQNEETAKQNEEIAKQNEETAKQNEEIAKQNEEIAKQNEALAIQQAEQERKLRLQSEKNAHEEIARLKALLEQQSAK